MHISAEQLANMLASAHHDGWEQGHDMIPEPNADECFLFYLSSVEDMCHSSRHITH